MSTQTRVLELIFVGVAAALYLVPLAGVQYRIGDEGSLVSGALRLLEGQVPYRDFFEVMSPGSFLWLAAWFLLLGKTWFVLRVALTVGWVISVITLHWLTLQVHEGRLRFLPAAVYLFMAIPIWLGASQHWDSNTVAFIALVAYVKARDSSRLGRWIGCGVLVGLTGLFSQQKGAWLLGSLLLAEFARGFSFAGSRFRLRRSASLLAGATLVGVLWMAVYVRLGAFDDFFYAVVRWPLEQYGATNRLPYAYGLQQWIVPTFDRLTQAMAGGGAVSHLLLALSMIPFAALLLIPVVVFLVPFTAARRRDERSALLTAYALAGAGLFLAEGHRPDIPHLLYGTPVLWVVAAAIAGQASARRPAAAVRVSALILSGGLLVVGLLNLVPSGANAVVHSRRGDYRAFRPDEALAFLQSHTSPGDTVFVYPYYPMYYFLAEVKNPTRYSVLMYGINTDAQFREAIDAIDADRTRFVLSDEVVSGDRLTEWFPEYRHPAPEDQLMERYLADNYRHVATANGFRILERHK